ncbi:MAG TPA: alpha/beta family hydrolase [Pyrinomonadaceae bacterium]|jgi:predicted alpha/beta-hydrolase family hydrolase|nr:alpha/beta family hydrolase [Pyrinomonadaceae bacterium]
MTESTKLTVQINDANSITAILYSAAKKNRACVTIILGHGAGADQMSGFMRMMAAGFAARGLDAMTFNFLYKEQKRGAPDPKAKLEACYRAVIDAAMKHKQLTGNGLVIGGKSMGGRIASQVAAEDSDGIAGLVHLGYPLHPPGRLDKMRAEHLPKIKVPMLFVQGARDAFGTEDEIKTVIKKHRLKADLYTIAAGDHSFKVPKSLKPQQQVYEEVMDEVARWCRKL